jgi:hypothetical protein
MRASGRWMSQAGAPDGLPPEQAASDVQDVLGSIGRHLSGVSVCPLSIACLRPDARPSRAKLTLFAQQTANQLQERLVLRTVRASTKELSNIHQ